MKWPCRGRAAYWAESAPEVDGVITFHMLNYEPFAGRILKRVEPSMFTVEYFGTAVEFSFFGDVTGGTGLSLVASLVDELFRWKMAAGWVSVLMAMKAAGDHGVDRRNHDPSSSRSDSYADN
ncbi:hypothetical protein [Zoogloea sp.]|uniref:hypothetical protein n=1 Tax=Zoogloea sp. TaxID=49181 RepID=UPI001ACF5FCA|nr:hypothetical protein [Zoogloea sp.]MBN8285087.1 hypothetical protein [Zoogloea sp.]